MKLLPKLFQFNKSNTVKGNVEDKTAVYARYLNDMKPYGITPATGGSEIDLANTAIKLKTLDSVMLQFNDPAGKYPKSLFPASRVDIQDLRDSLKNTDTESLKMAKRMEEAGVEFACGIMPNVVRIPPVIATHLVFSEPSSDTGNVYIRHGHSDKKYHYLPHACESESNSIADLHNALRELNVLKD